MKKKSKKIIVFKKRVPEDLFNHIIHILQTKKIDYTILMYGSFEFKEYQNLLDTHIGMIYLQESESQGIVLQEARMKNVPTLIGDRGYWTYQDQIFYHNYISCPYFPPDVGMTFKGKDDFVSQLGLFINNLYTFYPRKYALNHLSDNSSLMQFKKIVKLLEI